MLYHSRIKHFVKGLIGRKNDAWHFDRMISAYHKSNGNEIEQLIYDTVNAINPAGNTNEMYTRSFATRFKLIEENRSIHSSDPGCYVLQLPSASYSPAFHSWFKNIGNALSHLGHIVHYEWQPNIDLLSNADYIFTCFNQEYLSNIRWNTISPKTKVICYCNPFLDSEESVNEHIAIFKKYRIDAAFTFCNENFAKESLTGINLNKLQKPLISIPFSVNPLFHFPAPIKSDNYSFIFLGSANWDKAKRYAEYFHPLVLRYKGIIYGQGWPWTKHQDINFERDRKLYAAAAIGLNLHIDIQLKSANELNERTYILGGIGQIQICDSPPALRQVFGERVYNASTPEEYLLLFEWLLNNPAERLEKTKELMLFTLINHNTFNRAIELNNSLKNIWN